MSVFSITFAVGFNELIFVIIGQFGKKGNGFNG